MQHLYGESAFTTFQLRKIQSATGLQDFQSAEVFFLDARASLTELERERLGLLLQEAQPPFERAPDFIVIPRFGTLSPWSSKATEILHVCALNSIRRVERGVAFWATPTDTPELLEAVCDPMTQTIIRHMDEAERLFQTADPNPVVRRTLGSDPIASLEKANTE